MARQDAQQPDTLEAAAEPVAAPATVGQTGEQGVVLYDRYGREFRAANPVEFTNLVYGGGYSITKPSEPEELPTAPAGNPGPLSGAVRS
jgi:hypothetical protein